MEALPGPAELQVHFEQKHSEGVPTEKLVQIEEDGVSSFKCLVSCMTSCRFEPPPHLEAISIWLAPVRLLEIPPARLLEIPHIYHIIK